MSRVVIAEQDDTLDKLLYRSTGNTNGVEDAMMSDPELVENIFFEAGQHVVIPTQTVVPHKQTINLWD